MIKDLVIIGYGGFGREVADVVDAINAVEPTWNLLGFVDDAPSPENVARVERRGSKVIGTIDNAPLGSRPHYVVGVGNASARARLAARAERQGWIPATLVHPTAQLGASLALGPGSIVCANVGVGSDVSIGLHVHLDRGVQVGHDSTLADFVTVHPAAVISGTCDIQTRAELGTNCTLLPGIEIGVGATVGAAACVVGRVAPGTTVKGVPAK
ncbi:hypothetical protein [Aeromicrobium sp. CF3.5]|uniref:PglD-related sugar-binding protein n=1 Tax=Aeromicrobium sp. CF3.5 TaxID=3373078 RepID=UPI003EE81055